MRFCTSPSGVTMISRMRFSDSRMNSICLNTWLRRGVSTTPANCDRFDSTLAAAATTFCCGSPACSVLCTCRATAAASIGVSTVSIVSTNSR